MSSLLLDYRERPIPLLDGKRKIRAHGIKGISEGGYRMHPYEIGHPAADESLVDVLSNPFNLAGDFEKEKERIKEILFLLKSWFFDLLLLKKNQSKALLINKDLIPLLESQVPNFSIEKILRILDKVSLTEIDLNYNVNFRLLMETLLLLLI